MYAEPEIESLYLWAEAFDHSYFSFLDEYGALYERYLALFCALEETLNTDDFTLLAELLDVMGQMEEYYRFQAFREGVRLARTQNCPLKHT